MLLLARDSECIANVSKIALRKAMERSAPFSADMEKAVLPVAPQPLRDLFLIGQDCSGHKTIPESSFRILRRLGGHPTAKLLVDLRQEGAEVLEFHDIVARKTLDGRSGNTDTRGQGELRLAVR